MRSIARVSALLLRHAQRDRAGFVEIVTLDDDGGAELAHGFHLDVRSDVRHDDHRVDTQVPRRQGDALGMVASRCADHPVFAFPGLE